MPIEGVADMTCLSDLSEGSLLWNLKIRYDQNKIYVSTKNSALKSYRFFTMDTIFARLILEVFWLPSIHTKCLIFTIWIWSRNTKPTHLEHINRKVLSVFVWWHQVNCNNAITINIDLLCLIFSIHRHLFAIGSAAYTKMNKDRSDQVVVIRYYRDDCQFTIKPANIVYALQSLQAVKVELVKQRVQSYCCSIWLPWVFQEGLIKVLFFLKFFSDFQHCLLLIGGQGTDRSTNWPTNKTTDLRSKSSIGILWQCKNHPEWQFESIREIPWSVFPRVSFSFVVEFFSVCICCIWLLDNLKWHYCWCQSVRIPPGKVSYCEPVERRTELSHFLRIP